MGFVQDGVEANSSYSFVHRLPPMEVAVRRIICMSFPSPARARMKIRRLISGGSLENRRDWSCALRDSLGSLTLMLKDGGDFLGHERSRLRMGESGAGAYL